MQRPRFATGQVATIALIAGLAIVPPLAAAESAVPALAQAVAADSTDEALRKQRAEYQFAIHQAIARKWSRHKTVKSKVKCDVRIEQNTDGTVRKVETFDCTGDDAFRQSIESAVWSASPLPLPTDPSLFGPELQFRFQAE